MKPFDLAIVGGGIVGLATAYRALERFSQWSVLVLEKEPQLGAHQTGHNSGVLHSGIYYRPGSLKATNCRAGKAAMEHFCQSEGIPFEICGKVIVATSEAELPALQTIYDRGVANEVQCRMIERQELQELEPYVEGIKAIHVPEAGIVNFRQVCDRLAQRVCERGAQITTSAKVSALRADGSTAVVINTTRGDFTAKHVVNCGGLYSDRLVKAAGDSPPAKIVPFRGEYYRLRPEAERLCRNLIYPVPNPKFPFLGVHFTRMIGGGVECGPNAVLALSREGYRWTDVRIADLVDTLTYRGFWKLSRRYWRIGIEEVWRSLCKRAFVRALRKLVPAVESADLEPAPAGVRAQAVAFDGQMVDDFLLQHSHRVLHVCNAPSPAATASLNIGSIVVDTLVGSE